MTHDTVCASQCSSQRLASLGAKITREDRTPAPFPAASQLPVLLAHVINLAFLATAETRSRYPGTVGNPRLRPVANDSANTWQSFPMFFPEKAPRFSLRASHPMILYDDFVEVVLHSHDAERSDGFQSASSHLRLRQLPINESDRHLEHDAVLKMTVRSTPPGFRPITRCANPSAFPHRSISLLAYHRAKSM